jgi:hypothetical protein
VVNMPKLKSILRVGTMSASKSTIVRNFTIGCLAVLEED